MLLEVGDGEDAADDDVDDLVPLPLLEDPVDESEVRLGSSS